MRKLSSDYLLSKLKEKYSALGRTPTKEDIDKDESMPHSSTYLDRFGGIVEACKLAGIPVNKVLDLTLDDAIEFAKNFYRACGRVPTVTDFDKTPNFPHSSFIRKDLKMTWNRFLTMAGLPIFTNGDAWIKNFRAENFVKSCFDKAGINYVCLSDENSNAPNSFIINGDIRVDVRHSSPVMDKMHQFWKFKLHLKSKKVSPDYFICVGFNKDQKFPTVFVIPIEDLAFQQESISINIDKIDNSKYAKYLAYEITSDMF